MVEDDYKKGKKVTDEGMEKLDMQRHSDCPLWNYSLKPRRNDHSYLKEI
jgi:hypothetical protein